MFSDFTSEKENELGQHFAQVIEKASELMLILSGTVIEYRRELEKTGFKKELGWFYDDADIVDTLEQLRRLRYQLTTAE